MDPDWFRLAAGLPFAAPVVEVAHQLFLFGVDRDDRLTGVLNTLCEVSER